MECGDTSGHWTHPPHHQTLVDRSRLPRVKLAGLVPKILIEGCTSDSPVTPRELSEASRSPEVTAVLQRCESALSLADKYLDTLVTTSRRVSGGSSLAASPDSSYSVADSIPEMSGRHRICHSCHGLVMQVTRVSQLVLTGAHWNMMKGVRVG